MQNGPGSRPMNSTITRRQFLGATGMAAGSAPFLLSGGEAKAGAPVRRPRVAAIYTVCHHRSHAHVILENFLTPYLFNGKLVQPTVEVVSIYADQIAPSADLTEGMLRRFRLPHYKTISEALTLGGKELAVDAVLSIGEHGNYPTNKLGVR